METTPMWVRRTRRKRRRWAAPLWIVLVLAAGFGVNAWLAVRRVALETRVRGLLKEALACPFELERFDLGLTSGAELHGLRLLDPETREPVVSVETVRIVPRVASIFRGDLEAKLVELVGLDVLIEHRDGRFRLEELLAPRSEAPARVTRLPQLVVRSCRVRVRAPERNCDETIEDLELALAEQPDGSFSFTGQLQPGRAASLSIDGRCVLGSGANATSDGELTGANGAAPSSPSIEFRVQATKLALSTALVSLLAPEIGNDWKASRLEGGIDLDAEARFTDGKLEIRRFAGRLVGGQIGFADWPMEIGGLAASFSLREDSFRLEGIEARLGGGSLTGHAALEVDLASGRLRGAAGRLALDRVLVRDEMLRVLLADSLGELAFQGRASGWIELDSHSETPSLRDVEAHLEIADAGVETPFVPFPLQKLRGIVSLREGQLAIEEQITAEFLDARVTIPEGQVELDPPGVFGLTLRIGGEPGWSEEESGDPAVATVEPRGGLRLDDRTRRLIPPDFSILVRLYDDFQFRGSVNAVVRVERTRQGDELGELVVTASFVPEEIRIAHRSFPFEVDHITGRVVYDSETKLVSLLDIRGQHGDQVIVGSGGVDVGRNGLFSVTVKSDSVVCDPDSALVAALDPRSRALVQEFGFRGRLSADVLIHSVPDRGVETVAELDLLEGSIRPNHFPYPLELGRGKIVLIGENVVDLRGVETKPGQTPRVVFDGSIAVDNEEQRIEYALEVESLAVDNTLLEALPLDLDQFFRRFGLAGTYHGKLEGWYVRDLVDPAKSRLFYEGKDVRSDNAQVDFGIHVKDVKALGRFVGGHTPQHPNHFWGTVDVSSAWFNRLHLTNGEVLVHYGEPHAFVKADLEGHEVPGRSYRIPAEFLERCGRGDVSSTFQMSISSPDVYGGTVDGFLYADTGAASDLAGDFVASGLQLARASKDIFGVDGREVTGTAEGDVRFRGKTGDAISLVGKGQGLIKRAQLVELPFFIQSLQLLKLDFAALGSRSYFSDVLLPYEIREGAFHAENLEIRSPAITLVGGGTLDFLGRLDLILRPQVVDAAIPLWDQLVGLLKDALARVRIRGDLAAPKVEFVTAGGLIGISVDTESSGDASRTLPRDSKPPPRP